MRFLRLKITSFIYSSAIGLFNACLPIFSFKIFGYELFSSKQRAFYMGRKKDMSIIKKNQFEVFRTIKSSVIWFHCASLGEFEQIRPLIQKTKKHHPEYKIALTFFSPSGYIIAKNYSLVDWVGYLPLDTLKKMNLIIKFINPKILVLSKNEFWPNMLYSLKKNKVPVVSISSYFKNDNYFWFSWALWFKDALKTVNHFYLANRESEEILNKNGILNTTLAGDMRMDRVLNILNEKRDLKILDDFLKNDECWIAGSIWNQDYSLFMDFIHKEKSPKVILAPHECSQKSISSLIQKLKIPYVLWSNYSYENDKSKKIIILDKIGILKHAYRYAKFVYIGGGMGKSGLHNIIEAAVYDKPIIIGENYKKFPEAIDLIKKGGCFSVSSKIEFEKITKKINEELNFGRIINHKYVKDQQGATKKILVGLKKYL